MNVEDQNGQEETTRTPEIGAALARRRQEKGLSLRDVEQATKIRTRYLEGLEQEDYDMLPDQVYVRGFLKTYANFLGLDGERLSREFKEQRGPRRDRHLVGNEGLNASESDQPLVIPGGLSGAERRRISGATLLTVALALIALAVVVGVLYFIGSQRAESPSQEPASDQQQSVEGPDSDQQGAAGGSDENTLPQAVRATVSVVGPSSTGMTIRTDGTVAYDAVAQSGFSQTFEAQDKITVEARNGGAVEVEANGQSAERLGNSGQPVTREFTPEQPGE